MSVDVTGLRTILIWMIIIYLLLTIQYHAKYMLEVLIIVVKYYWYNNCGSPSLF